LLNFIERSLLEPDAGIWEFRNLQQLHSYSFLFHWAGANAALKIATHYQDEELQEKARRIILQSAAILEDCFDAELGAYCQAAQSKELDASTLQLISLGYLKPNSARAKSHLSAIEKKLVDGKERVFRYLHSDDFGKPENSFLICSYWYVDALALCGELEKAKSVFQELLKYTNHLGLLSEDVSADGSQWGNFPQTYSHVGLMNAAFRIGKLDDKPTFL
jgi:glucoamylase